MYFDIVQDRSLIISSTTICKSSIPFFSAWEIIIYKNDAQNIEASILDDWFKSKSNCYAMKVK